MIRTSKIALTILLTSILALGTGACDDDDDVTGTNLPPIANAGADATFTDVDGNGAQQVTLDGTESEDPDGSIQVYRWFDELGAVVAGGPTATPTLDVGVHVITLEVVDDQGASDTDEVTITVEEMVENLPPEADAGSNQTVVDFDGSGSELVTLIGSASSDPDGVITAWAWTEGDLAIGTGQIAEVLLSVGTHEITLTVTDDDLATDADVVVITVEPQQL